MVILIGLFLSAVKTMHLAEVTCSLLKSEMKVKAATTLSVDRFNYVKVETDECLVGTEELHPVLSPPFIIL